MTNDLFRLEFNEKQQAFHMANIQEKRTVPYTFGWITIIETCTEQEHNVFMIYLDIRKRDRIKGSILTNMFVYKVAEDLRIFLDQLVKNNISIP